MSDGNQCDVDDTDYGSDLLNAFARVSLPADDAKHRLHSAQVRKDIPAVRAAQLEYEERLGDFQRFKERTAADFMVMVRCVQAVHPSHLRALLDPDHRKELDVTQDAVVQVEQRVDRLEQAVVQVKQRLDALEQEGTNG